MPLIPWNDELSVGVNSLDEQHKQLVALINELHDAFQEGKSEEVLAKVFDELAVYTIKHFSYEEELFARYGYAESQAHKKSHEALIKQVKGLRQKLDDGDFMISLEVMVFLKEWLMHHIMKTDKAYAPFLIEKGVR